MSTIGPFSLNTVVEGDCVALIPQLPDESVDLVVTSPPYWGQRTSLASGTEEDPRDYLANLTAIFSAVIPKLKPFGLIWINIGDAYNTPVNWRAEDRAYSSLGADKKGLAPSNSAYVKNRSKRKPCLADDTKWLKYGNLLALPYRLVLELCEHGLLFRGEVIWRKKNPMPEGKCRRPHRQHESIFLFAKREDHSFRVTPPVQSIWEIANDKIEGEPHYSRFPEDLPFRCITAYGRGGSEVTVLDPFAGSGTTNLAAVGLGCCHIGFEVDPSQVKAANDRIAQRETEKRGGPLFTSHEPAQESSPALLI